jgi:hypothetical protein
MLDIDATAGVEGAASRRKAIATKDTKVHEGVLPTISFVNLRALGGLRFFPG